MHNEKHNFAYPVKLGQVTKVSEHDVTAFRTEDIPHQRVAITLSNRGFIKRVPMQAHLLVHHGNKGIIGMVTREDDAVRLMIAADTHDNIMFFTNRGKVFRTRCYEIPAKTFRTAKGTAVVNLFPIAECEKISAMIPVTELKPELQLLMVTRNGEIKKTPLDKFAAIRSSGIIAMDLEAGDELVAASLVTDQDDVMLVTQKGKVIRFAVGSLRASSRMSGGVRGVKLTSDDQVVGVDIARPKSFILLVTVNGYGKLVPVTSYQQQKRGGGGVKTFSLNDKTGPLATAKLVTEKQQLMMISADGIVISTYIRDKKLRQGIAVRSRGTQGVCLIRLDPGDKVVAIAVFD